MFGPTTSSKLRRMPLSDWQQFLMSCNFLSASLAVPAWRAVLAGT